MALHVCPLGRDGLERFAEIDRSEELSLRYRQHGTTLTAESVREHVPGFRARGAYHSVEELVRAWQPVVDAGGLLLGAFEEHELAGIALLGGAVAPGVHQLALLYVSRAQRRRGV